MATLKVLHGYRLVQTFVELGRFPTYPSFTLFRKFQNRSFAAIRRNLARTSSYHGLILVGDSVMTAGGRSEYMIETMNMLSAAGTSDWGWGRYARTSLHALLTYLLMRTWYDVIPSRIPLKDPNPVIEPKGIPPHDPKWVPRPGDDPTDYASFLDRIVTGFPEGNVVY